MPRQPTCLCGTCKKCRDRIRAKARYDAMTVEERRAWTARRDPAKMRAADKARYQRDKAKRNAAMSSLNRRNALQTKARRAVRTALSNGGLVREPCLFCDNPAAEAHHHDYTQPLAVTWLCRLHHGLAHGWYAERNAA